MRPGHIFRLPDPIAALLVAVGLAAMPAQAYSLDAQVVPFSVPAQPIETALIAYAEQAHVQLVVSNTILKGLGVRSLSGSYNRQTALNILLRDTGLEFQVTGPDIVTVTKKQSKD